jgi:galactose mutarotase-like enzyme
VQHLVDAASGRELFWQGPTAEAWPRDEYMAGVAGGWDNVFPNDHPWGDYPDHGRVWSSPFEVVSSAATEATLRTELASPGVEIVQRYSLLGDGRRGLRQETTLSARSATGPFLWSSHPMLAVEPGWRIELPPTEIRTDPEYSGRLPRGAVLPPEQQEEALAVEPHESSFELRFAQGVREAAVASPDGARRTRLAWDGSFLEHLWIVTISGFPPVDLALQLETSSSHTFDLGGAIESGTAASLEAGEERTFWVEIESLDRT